MPFDYQKYLPGLAIGVVALYAIAKLGNKGSRPPIISNALLPSGGGGGPVDRDPARVAGFGRLTDLALGGLRLQEQSANIGAQLELGKFRLQEQGQVLQSAQANSLELEKLRQAGASERLIATLADRNFDREIQRRAIEQTGTLARQGQIGQGLGNLLGVLLDALGRRPSSSGRGSGGGGSGGGPGGGSSTRGRTPPTFPSGRYPQGCSVFGIPIPCGLEDAFGGLPSGPGYSGFPPGYDYGSGGYYDPGYQNIPGVDYGGIPPYPGGGESGFPGVSFPGDPGYDYGGQFPSGYDYGSGGYYDPGYQNIPGVDYGGIPPYPGGGDSAGYGNFGGSGGYDYDYGNYYDEWFYGV